MEKYHKIQTVFKRDPETKFKTLLNGQYSMPEFEYLKDCEWIGTEKVDGTNIRVMFDGDTISFGGKTDQAQIPSNLINRLNKKFLPQIETFENLFINPDQTDRAEVCLYGEGYGAKIQKGGGNYRLDQDFVLFDIKIGQWWLKKGRCKSNSRRTWIRPCSSCPCWEIGRYDSVNQKRFQF